MIYTLLNSEDSRNDLDFSHIISDVSKSPSSVPLSFAINQRQHCNDYSGLWL